MKKEIPPILGIAIILVISVPIILYLVGEITSFSEMQTPVIIKTEIPVKNDNYYFDLATKLDNVSLCDRIKDFLTRDECYFEIAISLNDSSPCDKISERDRINQCKAMTLKDIKFCDDITDINRKNRCFMSLAYSLNNLSLCKEISNKYLLLSCKAIILKDLSLCEDLEDADRDGCLFVVALALRDRLICDRIIDEIMKKQCYDTIKNLLNEK